MCGFFISNSSKVSLEHSSLIENKLRFRGPDCSSGLIEHNGWKAYHSRLSIIDLSVSNNQPMIDKTGGMLVFNGEILNFKDLGKKYFNKTFSSDTDLLSNLISNDLLDIKELDGFFAFVYITFDGKLKHAVRDSFGVKPLFYHQDEFGISFCSEPNVLKEIFKCKKNKLAIEEYYATRAPIFSGSYFEGIRTITPGTCFIYGEYFDCSEYLDGSYKETNIIDIKEALIKGLNTRMIADVPVGLLLSRGIDSNLLRCIGNFDKYYT
ncbi:asparagine synthase, partial [Providencia rettgeri]|uniref:asparagine synthase-related protein n=1 Tax=Providencia rettgeri TaxID=587 RepID=UPI001B547C53